MRKRERVGRVGGALRRLTLGCVAAALLLAAPAVAAAAATAPSVAQPADPIAPVSQAVSALPDSGASGALRKQLLSRVGTIRTQIGRGRLCAAHAGLAKLRAAGLRSGAGAPSPVSAAGLAASTLQAESGLLERGATRACGGAATPGAKLGARRLAGGPNGLTLQLTLPRATFAPIVGAGLPSVSARMAGLQPDLAYGDPAVLTTTSLVAVPHGARVVVRRTRASAYALTGVPLEPYADTGGAAATPFYNTGLYAKVPFSRSPAAYRSSRPTPASVVALGRRFRWRGVDLVPVTVSATRYLASKRRLSVYSSVNVKLAFVGGGTTFAPSWFATPANAPFAAAAKTIANLTDVMHQRAKPRANAAANCREMLIVTDKAYKADAERLAAHKQAIGISTRVVTTKTLTSQAKIHKAIYDAINASCAKTPLNYVILLGSTKAIPPFTRHSQRNADYPELIATDYPYFAANYITPFLESSISSVLYGRLPARTAADAKTMVDKIISYENAPPNSAYFRSHTSVAGLYQVTDGSTVPSQYQEVQSFIETLEAIRDRMHALGKTVDRFYSKEAEATPVLLHNGTFLPLDLLPTGNFPWNSTGADVTAAVNSGRSVIFHDDHGFTSGTGWAHPDFNNGQIASLHNGAKLPFVISADCDTGDYQNTTTPSFAEQLVTKSGGGAIGVIAGSRMTNTGINGTYALSVGSAIYGGLMPGGYLLGLNILNSPTMGGVLQLGTLLLGFVDGGFNEPAVIDYRHQYNLFGDPSLVYVK